jgi:2-polyprenyl-3-methyl-5-hydroxy-6-metoxy-1,4-benzoquinol methylase
MKNLTEYIGSQFGNPRGIIGKICCICMNIINKKLYVKVSDTVKENSCSNILDIGFGNGYLEKRLIKQTNTVIKGIDISEDMKKVPQKEIKRVLNKAG